MGTRLYVGNLSYDATENDLNTLFQEIGTCVKCEIPSDRETGRPKGFAFVEMGSQEDADKAIEKCHGKDFMGRELTVNEARPRAERTPQHFGGGFGGGYDGGYGQNRGGGGKRKGSRRGLRNEKRSRKGIL